MAITPIDPTSGAIDPDSPDIHLERLLMAGADEPWYKSFAQNLKELVNPAKLPPLDVTSKPVAVKDIWGFTGGNERFAGLYSIVIHGAGLALLIFLFTSPAIQKVVKKSVTLIAPDLAAFTPQVKPAAKSMGGGGGGGDRSPLPASKGRLPRIAPRQFTPPMAVVNNPDPKLIMEPTLVIQPDANLPQVNMAVYGNPLGKIGPPSNGTGSGGANHARISETPKNTAVSRHSGTRSAGS